MPENHPTHDLGHLDIDAVSAFVDRDLAAADLAAIEVHLTHCPACGREVLEIRTTILLLATLPQYAPRRSFCLGSEHARAGRRLPSGRGAAAWEPPPLTTGQPGAHGGTLPLAGAPGLGLGWMPGLQVAALVVGALLLLVTAGDLTGLAPNDAAPLQLAAPTALALTPSPPLAAMPAPDSARSNVTTANDADLAEGESAAPFEAAFRQEPAAVDGTENRDGTSQEMLAGEEQSPRLAATSAAVAAVTQAIPTPGAASNPSGDGNGAASSSASATNDSRPPRLRIVQIGLALLLAWLIVSIVGLRWVRRTRQV